jgi:TPR repeat protein
MKTLGNLIALAATLLLAVGSQAADKTQVENYRKAAEQGSPFDQTMLASCYKYGNGVVTNATEAVQWYRKAAEQGYRPARILLGFCYKNGEGVSTNEIEAVKWFRKAAEHGDELGQYMLGFCHQYGTGVSSNNVEALKWFNLAAAQDYDLAKKTQSEVRNLMTKEQIAEAQRLAGEFKPQKAP